MAWEREGEWDRAYRALNELSRAWMLPVVHALGQRGRLRFNDLKRSLRGISSTCLAQRLRELERMGLVERKVRPDKPPSVEYALTKRGHSLFSRLSALAEWARA
ncbi:MAG: transcriptional regulator [Nitrososphaerota archaeon]